MNKEDLKILLVEDDEDDAFFIKDLISERDLNPRPVILHALNPKSALFHRQLLDFAPSKRRSRQVVNPLTVSRIPCSIGPITL